MSGDVESERTYQVQRMEIFHMLVSQQHVRLLDAEHWVRAWESKAEELGRPTASQGFWDEGWRWIVGELTVQRRNSS